MRPLVLAALFVAAAALGTLAPERAGHASAEGEVVYVALGDSISQGIPVPPNPGLTGYAWIYKDYLAADRGAPVTFINRGASGSPSLGLLNALNNNTTLQTDVTAADVITFTVGTNDLWQARDDYVAGTCDLACMWSREGAFEANWDAILTKLKELNTNPTTTFRTVDIYNPHINPDQTTGTLAVWQPILEEANRHMCETAIAQGMPIVRVYDAYNGLSGTEDAFTKGYLHLLHPKLSAATIVADEMRAFDQEALPWDSDGDCVLNSRDNCPADANPTQDNADRNYVDLPPSRAFDDKTWSNSDAIGDACDTDDDNDGLADTVETASPPCASASAATDPLLRDTDGDRRLDGAECALGSDPASAASTPPTIVTPDADGDGLPDPLDPDDGNKDTDGDGLRDGVEFRNYNSDPASANTDGDACGDAREATSFDLNMTVNAADLGLVASEFGAVPPRHLDMDVDKNGTVNAADIGLVASKFGSCP